MTVYIFDMDGTLTPPRLPMKDEFAIRFNAWQKSHCNFIATGSDYVKVQEQMPANVINDFTGIYSSMGNMLTKQGKIIYKNEYNPDKQLIERLEWFRRHTEYSGTLYSNYLEPRIGMVNFSVIGRNCPYSERERYTAWDKEFHERSNIQKVLQSEFPDLEISIGGSISIDITPKGYGKGQIAKHLRAIYPNEKIIFFGDKTYEGGNDYELSQALLALTNTEVIQVDGPDFVLQYIERN